MRKMFLFDQESVNLSDSKPRCADDLRPVDSPCVTLTNQMSHNFEETKGPSMASQKQQEEDVDHLVGSKRLHHDLVGSPMLKLDHRHESGVSPSSGGGHLTSFYNSRVNHLEQSPPITTIMENFGEILPPQEFFFR